MHRHDERPATLQFRGTETRTPTPAPTPPIGGGSEPGRRRNSRLEAGLEALPLILQIVSDTTRTASAWSLTYLVLMRMPAPSCQGHRYIGVAFAPIGSERRRSPPPAPRSEVGWSTCRPLGPVDCKGDRIEQGLGLDFLDPLSWTEDQDRAPGQDRRARRLPDPPRPWSPDCRRGDLPRCCPTPKSVHPAVGASAPRDPETPDLLPPSPWAPPSPPAESARRLVEDSKDSEDQGPGAAWARQVGWHHTIVPHVDRSQRCPSSRCPCGRLRMPAAPSGPRAGGLPTTPGGGSSPIPSRWHITRTQKGESGGSINVTATSMDGALLLLKSAVAEPGWCSPQEEAKGDAGVRSSRARE